MSRDRSLRARVLALDIGSRRIGVAVSDELLLTAQGLETIAARPREKAFELLHDLVREYNVKDMVLGLPINMDGTSGIGVERVREFAHQAEEKLSVTIHLVDERLTSVQAERILLEADLSRERRRTLRDKLSAVLILQSFLDRGES